MSRRVRAFLAWVWLVALLTPAYADQTREGLISRDFETATDRSYWQLGYYAGGATTSSGFFQGANAHQGQWYLYLGDLGTGYSNADGYAYQYLNPRPEADATYIDVSYYINVTSAEGTSFPYDQMTVALRFFDDNLNFLQDVPLFGHDNRTQDALGVYRFKQVRTTLGNLAGRWVALIFKVKTDSSNRTTFRIDNVSAVIGKPDPQYAVTATAGAGGTISPPGTTLVTSGGNIDFTGTPNANYTVNEWRVDGNVVQTGGTSFRLSNVTSPKSVSVSFVRVYNLTVVVNGQGTFTLTPPGGAYPSGTIITASATPANGYQFAEWGGNQSKRTPSFSFAKGGADETILVSFIPIVSAGMRLTTAQSTPSTIGINVPTSPLWFTCIEVSGNPSAGEWRIQSVVEGNGAVSVVEFPIGLDAGTCLRTVQFPKVSTAPFLDFPIHDPTPNATPRTAPVVSVFDHSFDVSNTQWVYQHNNAVRLTTGETFVVLPEHRKPGEHYAPIPSQSLPSLFNYVGYPPQGGPNNLQYDGHPGYDYGFGEGTDVYAAADGDVVTGGDPDNCTAEGLDLAAVYMKRRHALIIKHDNDYCTVYMHLSQIDSTLADTNNPNFWKPKAKKVYRGDLIGKVGKYSVDCSGVDQGFGAHFHFEVWRKDGDRWYFADPYGFQWGSGLNAKIITPYLWLQVF